MKFPWNRKIDMAEKKKKIFDVSLFTRLLQYIKPYRTVFVVSLFCVIGLAVFGALRPYQFPCFGE